MITLQTTSVPLIQFAPTGITVPSQAQVLAGVQADWIACFGPRLNLAPSTPQGQLMALQALQISACYALVAYIYNQVDPAQAEGFMQDALAQIFGITRLPATYTSVEATLNGLPNITVPVGYQARNSSTGDLYELTQEVTTDASGNAIGTFQCTVAGPIACPANALSNVYQGWQGISTITNTAAGIPGTLVESREAFELRRLNTIAANGQGSSAAVFSEIWTKAGVQSVYVTQNRGDAPIIVGPTQVSINPHSIYVCVAGAFNPADIGAALNLKLNAGCGMNGNQTVNVVDPVSGQTSPYSYQLANNAAVYYSINIKNSLTIPQNIQTLVPTLVVNQATGANGATPYGIGDNIIAFDMSSAIGVVSGVKIPVLSIEISNQDFAGSAYQVAGSNTVNITTTTWGLIGTGDTLNVPGVSGGLTVTGVGSFSNGVGTVQVSSTTGFGSSAAPLTITSQTAFAESSQMGIDCMPVFQPSNVQVNLV